MEKVSNFKNFFKNFLALVKDKDALAKKSTIIEVVMPSLRLEKNVNHIHRRMNIGRELCRNS